MDGLVNKFGKKGTPAIESYYPEGIQPPYANRKTDEPNTGQQMFGPGDPGGEAPSARMWFFYHPDYLDNVEYITDMDGLPYGTSRPQRLDQYFWYSPWGETIKQEKATTNTWETPYKFNGKEQDDETGLYYYGARYYNPQVSVWLSVDPMASERSWLTPYNFVQNNPILRTDPTGMLDGIFIDEQGNEIGNDGKLDGRVYLIKTSLNNVGGHKTDGITSKQRTNAILFIQNNSGNSGAFEGNDQIMESFFEIASSDVRNKAAKYIEENGSETNEAGFVNWYRKDLDQNLAREYKGKTGIPEVSLPNNEDADNVITLRIHSHMKGQSSMIKGNPSSTTISTGGQDGYKQTPSNHDYDTALPKPVNAIYSIPHNKVYYYNNKGVVGWQTINSFKTK